MKTAEQWQEELNGETSVQSIRQIQRDAMITCAGLLLDECGTYGNVVAGALGKISDKIMARANELKITL